MLLRSTSTPILKSLSPEQDLGIRIPTTRPISMSLSSKMRISRTSSETDLRQLSVLKKNTFSHNSLMSPVLVEGMESLSVETVSLLGGEGFGVGLVVEEEKVAVGGGIGGGGGGGICGGGGGGGDGCGDSGQGSESMDGYYQKMIKAYPGDALLLGNYARYLKEVRGDVEKAEEYCERAILAKACDGDVLSMYGDLIWNNHKDASRAQTYFDQAVDSAPDDCYVLASYAQFLWDAGEEEDDEDEQENVQINSTNTCTSHLNLSKGCAPIPPLAAAS